MARKKKDEEEKKEPPITFGEVSKENPSGIEKVSDEYAQHLGGLQGFGGPGAAGAVVAGPAIHVATEGGTKPLPRKGHDEDVKTSAGKKPGKHQKTSQEAALKSGVDDSEEESNEEHNQQAAA